MGLISRLKEDADALEKLNLSQHKDYNEQGELHIMNAKESAKAFAESKVLDNVVEKALNDRDDIMKAADNAFSGMDSLKTTKAITSSSSASKKGDLSSSSSKSSAWTSSSSKWGSSSSSSRFEYGRDNEEYIEKRVSEMMRKAKEVADDDDGFKPRSKRRKKRSLLDKAAPRHSKRRKAFIVLGIIGVESVMTVLAMTQQAAKEELRARRKKAKNNDQQN